MVSTASKIRPDTKRSGVRRFFSCALLLLCAFALVLSGADDAYAKGKKKKEAPNNKYASIVIDANTGMVISESNPDKKLHPASLTKAMTLMMMFDAINTGKVGLKDRIRISKHAASMVPSKLNLPIGSSIAVEDAIYALVTKSANDIAAAMGEHLGGTESNFAKMMTAKARRIGMSNTTFVNASGLHDPRQISSARDMAIMARTMIHDYPVQYKYFSKRYFTYQGQTHRNHNRLMETYKGMDGLKTGYVAASGFNLVASAVRGDRRLIGVVFGGRSTASRNAHMANLLDAGFENSGSYKMAAQAQSYTQAQTFTNVPIPKRKPAYLRALASLNAITPAAQQDNQKASQQASQWASLNTSLQNGVFGEMAGEGDMDPAASNRIKTGLIAISAQKAEGHTETLQPPRAIAPARVKIPGQMDENPAAMTSINDEWAIQIGAFTSRAQTDQALGKAVLKLPDHLRAAKPVIVPTKKGDGWLFRARLNGYSEAQALAACRYLDECIPVKPQTAR